MDKRKRNFILLTAFFFFCFLAPQLWAQPFILRKVIDLNTPIPDGTGNFASFLSSNPVISGNNVAFLSGDGGAQEGIYFFNGTTLVRVADFNTPIPGGSGNFTFFLSTHPVISGNNVAFHGGGIAGQEGIYLFNGAMLSKIADHNTPIPEGSGNFTAFGNFMGPFISDSYVVFGGEGSGQSGIYLFNGATLSKVADLNTPIPGGSGNFTAFSSPAISGENVVFVDSGIGQDGIYLFNGATLSKVADLNTPIPGGSGNFTAFSFPMVSGTNVVFNGYGVGSQAGIYLFDGTALNKVADLNTPAPNGLGNFIFFSIPVLSGNKVAFEGFVFGTGMVGVYLFDGKNLSRIADKNTSIPSGSGNFLTFSSPVISGNNVAFFGGGTGGQNGVYFFNGSTLSKVADVSTAIPSGTGNFTAFSDPMMSGDNIAFEAAGDGQLGFYLAISQTVSMPTLSEWGLIIFIVLAGIGSIYFLRKQQKASS